MFAIPDYKTINNGFMYLLKYGPKTNKYLSLSDTSIFAVLKHIELHFLLQSCSIAAFLSEHCFIEINLVTLGACILISPFEDGVDYYLKPLRVVLIGLRCVKDEMHIVSSLLEFSMDI